MTHDPPSPPRLDATEPGRSSLSRVLFAVPALIFIALAAVFAVRLSGGDPSRVPSALIGRAAPAVELAPLDGLSAGGRPVPGLSNAALRNGVTIVNVWASWCVPCREEHPLLTQLGRMPGIRVVGINYKDQPENARRFLGAFGNPFAAVGVDPNGRAAIDWGVYGVPETFVIGADGTIRHKQIGPLTPDAMPGFLAQIKAAVLKP